MPFCTIYTGGRKLLKHKRKDVHYIVKHGHLLVIQVHKQVAGQQSDHKSSLLDLRKYASLSKQVEKKSQFLTLYYSSLKK